MNLVKESDRVLQSLCKTHAEIKKEYLATVKMRGRKKETVFWAIRIEMLEYAKSLGLKEREFYLCIYYLMDHKYISNMMTDYSKSGGDWKIIMLTPLALESAQITSSK